MLKREVIYLFLFVEKQRSMLISFVAASSSLRHRHKAALLKRWRRAEGERDWEELKAD